MPEDLCLVMDEYAAFIDDILNAADLRRRQRAQLIRKNQKILIDDGPVRR